MGDDAPIGASFWVKLAVATLTAVLSALTLVWHDWIEVVFHADPDHDSGGLELLVLLVGFALTLALSLSARREWRRRTQGLVGPPGDTAH